MENEEARLYLQMLYHVIGKNSKYSIFDYLDYIDQVKTSSNVRQLLVIGLILALDYWKVINVSKKIRTGILFTGGIVMIAVFIWRICNGSPIVAIDFENSILYKKIISRLL